jgi:hypothetical protein
MDFRRDDDKRQSFEQNRVNLCPGHGTGGRRPSREAVDRRLEGHEDPGMFGRMFPDLEPLDVPDERLRPLAEAMLDADPGDTSLDNPRIPGGFTYLGQFADHGITLDLAPLSDKKRDPLGLENFRTPTLDLDNLYGLGPDGSPHLYARDPDDPTSRGPKLLIGENINVDFGDVTGDLDNDLPRSPEGMALIGDARNDENLLVAQTHLAFLKFHNAVVDRLAAEGVAKEDLFAEARRVVTWHYQFIILFDWVERLCGDGTVRQILHQGRKFYRFKTKPYMPVEFAAAAYRLGHSMVRQTYNYNRIFENADFSRLFGFTGLSGQLIGDLAPEDPSAPLPQPVLPSNWIIDWRRFHELDRPEGVPLNPSRRLDPLLVEELHDLPDEGGDLAFRNLERGVLLGLPSGQDVAAAIGVTDPLTPDEIATGRDGEVARQQGLTEATPLWYYILKEAKLRHDGEQLGPVGATIVAEVFVGLVHGDHESFLWQAGPDWEPTLPARRPGTFTMSDLLRFVDDVNPLGD